MWQVQFEKLELFPVIEGYLLLVDTFSALPKCIEVNFHGKQFGYASDIAQNSQTLQGLQALLAPAIL